MGDESEGRKKSRFANSVPKQIMTIISHSARWRVGHRWTKSFSWSSAQFSDIELRQEKDWGGKGTLEEFMLEQQPSTEVEDILTERQGKARAHDHSTKRLMQGIRRDTGQEVALCMREAVLINHVTQGVPVIVQIPSHCRL